ncbi:hypothetical protein [Polaromonas sp.]|uniref:hypothetical protein n=1 Tax=Polaromonas sp. TaxID=1869339 RepID=UPI003266158B
MSAQPSGASLRGQLRIAQKLRSLRALGWPALLGMSLALAGLLLLGVSRQLQLKQAELQTQSLKADQAIQPPHSNHARRMPAVLPNPSDYTADLARIFDIAKSQGIVLASGDYRDADRVALPVDVRVVDLRFNESYTKSKEFLAAVLNTMSHSAVQEVRIERKDSVAARHQVLLKLALVYASTEVKAPVPPLATQPSPDSPLAAGKGGVLP